MRRPHASPAPLPRRAATTYNAHAGTDIDDWLYSELPNADLSGKKVALFGLGDSAGYSGNFCDSVDDCVEITQ